MDNYDGFSLNFTSQFTYLCYDIKNNIKYNIQNVPLSTKTCIQKIHICKSYTVRVNTVSLVFSQSLFPQLSFYKYSRERVWGQIITLKVVKFQLRHCTYAMFHNNLLCHLIKLSPDDDHHLLLTMHMQIMITVNCNKYVIRLYLHNMLA